ncbi:MAG TPA: FtsX-like permease family protein [Thermoanaerobaculia bacterium]|nr:FtsX-like permease family protein [Thermoanaerobaculia bacterium]
MKYLPLLLSNLRRRKVRTIFTVLSIVVAFILFGYLGAIREAFSMGVDVTGADRLVTINKISLIQPLPIAYKDKIAAIRGVTQVTFANWFGGIYQDPKNFFPQIVVEPEAYLRMYPEFLLPKAEKEKWLADRTGAIVGRTTARRFGWKIGDRIPLENPIWRKKDGSHTWEFTIDGIYDGKEKATDTTQFIFHYKYFNESRAFGQGTIGWYIERIDDPSRAAKIADAIDNEFANSPYETKTSTEKAFAQSFAKQVGDIGAIISAILAAVFFTILLVAGNTMAQAVRERTNELAVLKTLGFGDRKILALVLAESVVIAAVGGGLGLVTAWLMIQRGDPTHGALPNFFLPMPDLVIGVALALALGIATGILPAWQARRLPIVDALRRV